MDQLTDAGLALAASASTLDLRVASLDRITGATLRGFTCLTRLELKDLADLSPDLRLPPTLQSCTLDWCRATGAATATVPVAIFTGLHHLADLRLIDCTILDGPGHPDLADLVPRLEVLRIQAIEGYPPHSTLHVSWSRLPHLRVLWLTEVTTVAPWWDLPPTVTEVNFRSMRLKDEDIAHLTGLQEVEVVAVEGFTGECLRHFQRLRSFTALVSPSVSCLRFHPDAPLLKLHVELDYGESEVTDASFANCGKVETLVLDVPNGLDGSFLAHFPSLHSLTLEPLDEQLVRTVAAYAKDHPGLEEVQGHGRVGQPVATNLAILASHLTAAGLTGDVKPGYVDVDGSEHYSVKMRRAKHGIAAGEAGAEAASSAAAAGGSAGS